MYKVIVKISHPLAKNKVLVDGVFVPKSNDAVDGETIRRQCADFIRKNMTCDEQDRKEAIITVTYKKLATSFILVEDKG